jgi:alpha-soluble NSF attachment protein
MAGDPRALLRQAETSLQKASGGFSFFGGRQDKYEAAAEQFVQAANAFRMQKMGTRHSRRAWNIILQDATNTS